MTDPFERRVHSNGEYIRSYYNVPAFIGSRIRYEGKPGRITGFHFARIIARVEGYERSVHLHPTWKVEYLDRES